MQISGNDISVGRVMDENEDFIYLEIAKNNQVKFTLNQGLDSEAEPDRFFTLLFLRKSDEGVMEVSKPWE